MIFFRSGSGDELLVVLEGRGDDLLIFSYVDGDLCWENRLTPGLDRMVERDACCIRAMIIGGCSIGVQWWPSAGLCIAPLLRAKSVERKPLRECRF